ncbi:wnt inhibitory factor 1-like [Narcine bancroftii]|uniref:wnt inhibitory factor 1-like n=1 Tax=Narcine bancroftii TaxID=1343680 RepID=UPI003831A0EC
MGIHSMFPPQEVCLCEAETLGTNECPRKSLLQLISASMGGGSLLNNGAMCCPGWEAVNQSCSRAVCWPGCQNGGICTAPGLCRCGPGFTGPLCQTVSCSATCVNGGSCLGASLCQCPVGFRGLQCETAVCVPSCVPPKVCVSPNTCACGAGWTGTQCESDVNECLRNNGGCEHFCTNTPGTFTCGCANGYKLDDDQKRCKALCIPDCWNLGICVAPNICSCLPWYSGHSCRQVIPIFNGR